MPIKRKKDRKFFKILIWLLIAALIILMLISFPAPHHMTETVVYP